MHGASARSTPFLPPALLPCFSVVHHGHCTDRLSRPLSLPSLPPSVAVHRAAVVSLISRLSLYLTWFARSLHLRLALALLSLVLHVFVDPFFFCLTSPVSSISLALRAPTHFSRVCFALVRLSPEPLALMPCTPSLSPSRTLDSALPQPPLPAHAVLAIVAPTEPAPLQTRNRMSFRNNSLFASTSGVEPSLYSHRLM